MNRAAVCGLGFLLGGAMAAALHGQTAGPAGQLERVRQANLEYVLNMPNFVADETAKRDNSRPGSQRWERVDTVSTEISFRGRQALRRNVRIDGRPWNGEWLGLPGVRWYGGFGTELSPVFDPRCPTTVEYEGTGNVRGSELPAYRFRSTAEACFPPFTDRNGPNDTTRREPGGCWWRRPPGT